MKLMADVIELAINKHLWDGCANKVGGYDDEFSCPAVDAADRSVTTQIKRFLQSMGVKPMGLQEFSSILSGPKRQYARALWLTWAAMIAREERKTL